MTMWSSLASMFPISIPLLLLTSALLVAIFRRRSKNKTTESTTIPGIPDVPNKHWLHGHMFYPSRDSDQLAKQKAWCIDHADPITGMCTTSIFGFNSVSVSNATNAQRILMTNTDKVRLPKIFSLVGEEVFGSNHVAIINGREWKAHRSPVTRALQSAQALRSAQRHILRVGENLVASIVSRSRANNNGDDGDDKAHLHIVPVMKMATIDIFCSAALGKDLGCCENLEPSEVATAFDFLLSDLVRRGKSPFSPSSFLLSIPTEANRRFRRENQILRDFTRRAIQSNIEQSKNGSDDDRDLRQNLLSQMIALKRQSANHTADDKTTASFNVDDVVNSMTVLLFAGYDTTANLLAFALHQVATNPSVEAKLVAEATTVLPEVEKLVAANDAKADLLSYFPYCHAVLLETLRLYPPAINTARILEKDVVLDGVTLPAGTLILIPIFSMHRDERNFPRSADFLPERWVLQTSTGEWVQRKKGDDEEEEVKGKDLPPSANREAYLPFSSGARNCAGRRFSLQESTLLLAMLVRKLKFELEPGYTMKPCTDSIIMAPSDGLPMVISPRT